MNSISPWSLETKKAFFTFLNTEVETRLKSTVHRLEELNQAMGNETKSSAGDKYETSREMLNQEINQVGNLKNKYQRFVVALSRLNTNQKNSVEEGCILCSDQQIFCYSIGLGKIQWKEQNIFCFSKESPFAKTATNKKAGDSIGVANHRKIIDWLI